MDWLILYEDGKEFTSEDGEAWEAPRNGVVTVIQRDDMVGWRIESAPFGFWCWKDEYWFGMDEAGYWDYRFHYMQPQVVLYGRWVRDDVWKGEMSRWIRERFGEVKSAWYSRELDPWRHLAS